MLDITEKIAAGACGLLILLTIGWYAFWGIPTTTPTEAIPAARPRPPAPAPPGAANEVERAKASAEDQAIIEKLAQQDVRVTLGQPLAKEDLQVDRLLLDHLKTEANWIPEINKLASRPIRVNGKKTDTRLKIFDIQPDSVAAKLGLQENDEILLLDAQIIEFNDTSAMRYRSLMSTAIEKIQRGEAVSITVLRKNRPIQLQFKL